MIERCLGHDAGARAGSDRALALNPHFSLLWAPSRGGMRSVKRLSLSLAAVAALAAPGRRRGAPARKLHDQPLQRDRASGDRVYVLYVLDLAEIPTFQERQKVPTSGAADARARRRSAAALALRVDGRQVALPRSSTCSPSRPGRPGLRTHALRGRATRRLRSGHASRSSTATRTSAAGSAGRRSSSSARDGAARGLLGARRRASATSSARTRRTCSAARSTCTTASRDRRAGRRRRRSRRRSSRATALDARVPSARPATAGSRV